MIPPTHDLTALEQWAREMEEWATSTLDVIAEPHTEPIPGSTEASARNLLALCESWREMQAEIDQRTQAWAVAADERDRANGEKDAAVARAEQARADRDALRDAVCPKWREKGLRDVLVNLAAAHRSDSDTMDDIGDGFDVSYRSAINERDAARAEVAHERLRYDGMRSDRDDWRQRAEQAQAEVAQARAELEQLRTAAASGWGEPTLVNMLKVENATLRAEIQSVRALLAEIAQEGR